MYYKVTINTEAYQCMSCSRKKPEPGTINDFMEALNGWKVTEIGLREVMWRMEMFRGRIFVNSEWEERPDYDPRLSAAYQKWLNKQCNTVTFIDKLCGIKRTHTPSGYGVLKGDFDINEKLRELKTEGSVRIYFSELYDPRQYNNAMDGCYMEIIKHGR